MLQKIKRFVQHFFENPDGYAPPLYPLLDWDELPQELWPEEYAHDRALAKELNEVFRPHQKKAID